MISAGLFKELNRQVFNQKLSAESEGVFTRCIDEAAEVMLVKMMLEGNADATAFLKKYQKHYPLCNKAVNLLIDGITDDTAKDFLKQEFQLYGYNEEQGLKICKLACMLDAEFLLAFARYGRVFYADVQAALDNIEGIADESLGKIYRRAVAKRRKS